jgi:hypothetical protein
MKEMIKTEPREDVTKELQINLSGASTQSAITIQPSYIHSKPLLTGIKPAIAEKDDETSSE